jgi:membrane associated rhomboid family serine protease
MIANGLVFIVTFFQPILIQQFGVSPKRVFEDYAVWELVTYMFVHGGPGHLLFNMLTLYLMGVELERMWGTRYFTKFYFACGIGAGVTQLLLGLLPGSIGDQFFYTSTIGASGAIFGVLLAYALYFPTRPILMFFLFPVPAKYFVMILGALALLFAAGGGGGVAHTAHLGGLVTGYLYLKAASPQSLLRDSVPLSQVAHQSHSVASSMCIRAAAATTSTGGSISASARVSEMIPVHRWDEIALEKITEMISRKIVTASARCSRRPTSSVARRSRCTRTTASK